MADQPPIFPGGSEILSQSDIDALISGAATTTESKIFNCRGEQLNKDGRKVTIENYDFRNPAFLTEIEMRQVRIREERFIHYLMARLSMFLRLDFSMKMSSLGTTPYQKFTESINSPNFITLFKFDHLPGVGLLEVQPRLAMTIVDRLLGGRGHSVRDQRYLTELEMALMDDVSRIVLEEWCRQWEDIVSTRTSLIGYENSGRFLQTSPSDTIMLVLTIEATLGDCSEQMQIAVPYYTIEPIVKQMQEKAKAFGKMNVSEKKPTWHNAYAGIEMPLCAYWKLEDMTVADVCELRPGDVLELPRDIIQKTRVAVTGEDRFVGEIGADEEHINFTVQQSLVSTPN